MHRFLNIKHFARNNIQFNSSSFLVPLSKVRVNEYKCSFCQTLFNHHLISENALSSRHHSTRAALYAKLTKKKKKYKRFRKYVEVLEVNKKWMNEKKVVINNVSVEHLSNLMSSPSHRENFPELTVKQTPESNQLNSETSRYITLVSSELDRSAMTFDAKNEYQPFKEDDAGIILVSSQMSVIKDIMNNKEQLSMIKESYTNFWKSTMRDQRLKDLNLAINEGINQKFEESQYTSYNSLASESVSIEKKGAQEIFRELLAEYRGSWPTSNNALNTSKAIFDVDYNEDINDINEEIDVDTIAEIMALNISIKGGTKSKKKESPTISPKLKTAKFLTLKKQKKEKLMKYNLEELEKKGKEESLNKLLLGHLELYCSLGMIEKAWQVLLYYRKRQSNSATVVDIRIYNIMLQGFASKGNMNMVNCLLKYMKTDGVSMEIQTYAAIFECIERSLSVPNKSESIQYYINEMNSKNLILNDMFDKGKFLNDQDSVVLAAIRKVYPNFSPQYTQPELNYVCPLLDHLNIPSESGSREIEAIEADDLQIKGLPNINELKERVKIQIQHEIEGDILIANIEVDGKPNKQILHFRKKLAEVEDEWRAHIKEAFLRNRASLKSQSHVSRRAIVLYPYLNALPVEQFVELILNEIRSLADGSESYSDSLKKMQLNLGQRVYERYQIKRKEGNGFMTKTLEIYDNYCEWYLKRLKKDNNLDNCDQQYNFRQKWQMLKYENRNGASLDAEDNVWPSSVCQNVGKFMYNIILHDIKINTNIMNENRTKDHKLPAFYAIHRTCGGYSREELKSHPVLHKLVRAAASSKLRVQTQLAPTLCPPTPWCSGMKGTHGGYLLTKVPIIRIPSNVTHQWKKMEQVPLPSLYPVLDSLNQLGSIAWTVNEAILDLQIKIFRSGGSKELEIARHPSLLNISELQAAGALVDEKKDSKFKIRSLLNRGRAEMYSLWCDTLYKLSLANHYRQKVFWLPHNMDFRGRVYPCPPHMTHLSADSNRALLLFASPRPLGPRGLMWLKLHCINLTGTMKKKTIVERLKHADEVLDDILDSADRPLDGNKWWAKSDEPWQTLACCMEIAKAIRSPNHEKYESKLAVHQDGSCNGLQHYAALACDEVGAASVNLAPMDTPQDVYSAVANLVEKMRERDEKLGVEAAVLLKGLVERKVIKQTVMTTVYGVTRFGARLQIAKQLKEMELMSKQHVWICSGYLTDKTFESLREMFTSAKAIQDWFTQCARVISGTRGESVEWVTPLGLPVVQPYYSRKKSVSTTSKILKPEHVPLEQYERPNTMKQKNGFPPNYIHSLDSSHMMLTALGCHAADVTFVSVHDCFWTHPCTVDQMNKICRDQFVSLHSQPILEDLSKFMVNKYGFPERELEDEDISSAQTKRKMNELLRNVPGKGKFKLRSVLDSVYFFS